MPGRAVTPALRKRGKVYEIFKAVKQRSLQSMARGEYGWEQQQQHFVIFRTALNSIWAVESALAAFIGRRGLVGALQGRLVEGSLLCPAGKGCGCCRRAAGHFPKGRRAPLLQLVTWLSRQQAGQVQ